MEPPLEFLICSGISKRFYLQWKAVDLLYKMRYILWVVALLGACDVTMFAHFQEYHRYREKNEEFTWFWGTLSQNYRSLYGSLTMFQES